MNNGVTGQQPHWPSKVDVFGVEFSCTNYQEVSETILAAAEARTPFVADFLAVDALVQAARSSELRSRINRFEIVCPDGHPVRVAMNRLHGTRLKDRVCGPDTCELLLQGASERGIPVFFYGSTSETLISLSTELSRRWPKLQIAGTYSPPFRALTETERDEIASMIHGSGAALVFIGLGAPKQSIFASEMQDRLQAGLLCVGAAFDFLARTKRRAPRWMQRSGTEWIFRLLQEPRRLARRYTVTNSLFLFLFLRALVTGSRT